MPPCGTIGVDVSLASLRMSATSATEPGRNTTGVWPWNMSRISSRYGACACGSVMACLSPTIAMKRARRSADRNLAGAWTIFITLARSVDAPRL